MIGVKIKKNLYVGDTASTATTYVILKTIIMLMYPHIMILKIERTIDWDGRPNYFKWVNVFCENVWYKI